MTSAFIRQLIVHTICNVTGEEPKNIGALDEVELNARDWEQVFSRLEATLDIHTGMLTSTSRSIPIDALTHALHTKLVGDIILQPNGTASAPSRACRPSRPSS